MPHSTRASTESQRTFDLDGKDDNRRPMSSHSTSTANTKRASGNYGVALTSTFSHDERSRLPSQSERPSAQKRKSMPGPSQHAIDANGKVVDNIEAAVMLQQRKPGDRTSARSYSYNDAAKRRTQYYEEQFQYKDNAVLQSREKVVRHSPVIAELKTNVIIKDEFTLVTDLSYHLAQRYTRPDSSVMIRVDHSACLALGGTFDPCYILTISAVTGQLGPSTNKRNSALIQSFMADILSVPAERGIVTFVAIPEENLAMNGMTMLGEVEKNEKQQNGDPNATKNAAKDAARKSMTFSKKSIPQLNGDAKTGGPPLTTTASNVSDKSATPPPIQTGNASNSMFLLYDQATSENTPNERPSTAHGHSFAAENGLRMNGISTEQLAGKNARLPNGRPKTFDGGQSRSIQDDLKKEPLPQISRSSYQKAAEIQRTNRPDAKKSTSVNTVPLAPRPVTIQPRPTSTSMKSNSSKTSALKSSAPPTEERRTKNTYLDGLSTLTNKDQDVPKIVTPDDDEDVPLAKTSSANTAKRRSTITATPKLPLSPPPVPDDSKSMSSKLGKRKSFLKMFKRDSTPAWYK